jgi:hypothetical protein
LTAASARYALPIALLLLLTAVPALLHESARFEVEDCAAPEQVLALGNGRLPDGGGREAVERYLQRAAAGGRYGAGDLPLGGGPGRLDFVILRSYDAKLVYHWPAARLTWNARGSQRPDRHALELHATPAGTLPVHRAFFETLEKQGGDAFVVAYLLVYHEQPVANPYLAQLRAAPLELVSGRRPMWLFYVSGRVPRERREVAEQAARDWLLGAWQRFRSACVS